MALKVRIFEKCQRCGQRAARKVGDYVMRLAHECPDAPPGPFGPTPHRFHATEVIFEPGEFSAEMYRVDLNEAWIIIDDLRNKRHSAEAAVKTAVEKAMRDTYNPSN